MSRAADFERLFIGESVTTPDVISRVDELWSAIISEASTVPITPVTPIEKYLANLIDNTVEIPQPVTRLDSILYAICTGGELEGFTPLSENEELLFQALEQRQNLFPYPYLDGQSKTDNGITYTVQSDKSIVANGTATANSEFHLQAWEPISLQAGTYKVSGCPSGGSASGYCINYSLRSGTEYPLDDLEYGNGLTAELPNGADAIYGNIHIAGGTTVNNLMFKPKLVKL